jgi:hypothetical protein
MTRDRRRQRWIGAGQEGSLIVDICERATSDLSGLERRRIAQLCARRISGLGQFEISTPPAGRCAVDQRQIRFRP